MILILKCGLAQQLTAAPHLCNSLLLVPASPQRLMQYKRCTFAQALSKGRDANPKIVIPSLSLTKAKCLATPSNWLLFFLIIIYWRYNESTVRKTKMRQ